MKELIPKLRKRIRISTATLDDEIDDLVNACKKDMELSGVYGDVNDPLYYQATVLYLKTYFGNNEQSENFKVAYEALKVSMALSGDYENGQK
ncbi:MAG: DNA-packaging protein [Faecalicatena sp.]|uniref:phage head-tail connector protein n=1 Tax=Faecalicatena sp. TaxID=2005360 RepID=UPI0025889A29|nr:DNA-packaging protein [Faecalicatena sp.]MCI6466388.1 DNA-packaging protein [Faecalicatena sp.]MCI7182359.1 DNA-packaging protein [Lachnospiraceae bacterium]MDY5619018.1 DNA-packaging protein [Lachnospiraceae bacterium]